ncbi:PIR protein [Plasmodium ovale]|uniref:PIR Superfamily Protein n=2 Tax=Plasmodium ovale TaxID=36330 RepID=A0A1A8XCV3_PLAOA|nr:PIR Superfamily Protein [Plasmodium ovale curtisi]SBT85102.1 PIR protein [Plasmodium ovale]
MPLEIQTIYNASFSNCIYKNRLDTYKNSSELENKDSCLKFTNSHLTTENNAQNICKVVMLFLSHLKEHEVSTYGYPKYKDTTYKDNGCKYLFYWLYHHVLKNKQTIKNVLKLYKELYAIYTQHHDSLNTFDKYINEMNEHTSDRLVKLTNLYNELDNFFTKNEEKKEKTACNSYSLETYFSYVEECRKGYDNDFCNELKNFRKKYNSFIKNVIKCEDQYLLSPVENFDIVDTTIIPLSLIPVTSLILPILYKFTAFGPWIRRLIGKNDNILEYINEETNHSLNTYDKENENTKIHNYNIEYNSV